MIFLVFYPNPNVSDFEIITNKDTSICEHKRSIVSSRHIRLLRSIKSTIQSNSISSTYAQQKSKHQYYNDNPDWGWTRFHGPWSDIHCRRRYQRKPLLENDTLGFTVYIQVIQDQTKSLWWHPSESQPTWDSMSLLGLPGLKCREHHSSAVVAAVSSWMHLSKSSLVIRLRAAHLSSRCCGVHL